MKSRMMKKVFAVAMSATLVMGMSLTAFAADTAPNATVTAPIYSFDVVDVVVPSTLKVAFNPDKLAVQTGATASDTENTQVLSHKVGILNKSSKDKIVTVTLTVTDKNTYANEDDPKITFVESTNEATGAEKGEYAIYLAVIPADTTEVKVGASPASADKDTAAADLANVTMTAASGKDVALSAGENKVAFKLDKATYAAKSTGGIVLGTDNSNDVQSKYEVSGLAADGKGITAFTFGGALNEDADWTKLSSGIEIKAVYTFTNPDGETAISGTAMVNLSAAPTFTAESGKIIYTQGSGNAGLDEITKIEGKWSGKFFDVTDQLEDDGSGTLTVKAANLKGWAGTIPVKVTYTNIAGDSVTTSEFNVTTQ